MALKSNCDAGWLWEMLYGTLKESLTGRPFLTITDVPLSARA